MKTIISNCIGYVQRAVANVCLNRSQKWQTQSKLRDPGLWGLSKDETGHLTVQGLSMVDLAERFGSPLLVVNQDKLEQDTKSILSAMENAPQGSQTLYSYKTNCIPGILEKIHSMGIGAEVISAYELWLAEKLGVPGQNIIYNGVNKTPKSLERAINLNVLAVNIDQHEEIDRLDRITRRLGKTVNVGVRLGLVEKSQFGLNIETGEAMSVCRRIKALQDRLKFNGIHFNVTSNAKHSSVHIGYIDKALAFIKMLYDETGMTATYLDIGGGIGVPTTKNMSGMEYGLYRTFGALPKPPHPQDFQPIEHYINDVIEHTRRKCRSMCIPTPALILEPGRFVTSRSEFLLATVLAIKEKSDGTRFAITDAGRLSMTFPLDFEYHELFLADQAAAQLEKRYNIMGRICTSADWMFKNRMMPNLTPGDVLAVMDAGAYFSSYSSNFAFPRPGIIVVEDGKARYIRDPESFQHLTALDILREDSSV